MFCCLPGSDLLLCSLLIRQNGHHGNCVRPWFWRRVLLVAHGLKAQSGRLQLRFSGRSLFPWQGNHLMLMLLGPCLLTLVDCIHAGVDALFALKPLLRFTCLLPSSNLFVDQLVFRVQLSNDLLAFGVSSICHLLNPCGLRFFIASRRGAPFPLSAPARPALPLSTPARPALLIVF